MSSLDASKATQVGKVLCRVNLDPTSNFLRSNTAAPSRVDMEYERSLASSNHIPRVTVFHLAKRVDYFAKRPVCNLSAVLATHQLLLSTCSSSVALMQN